jgi:hypothetical protein
MSDEERRKRLSDLGRIHPIAAQDHRFFLDENGQDRRIASLPRSDRRRLQKNSRRLSVAYARIIERIYASGAGYPVDKLLHALAAEYTNRYASSGLYNQPVSFNYFEPFCTIRLIEGIAPYAEPVDEVDHLFSIVDFFDFATSPASKEFSIDQLLDLPEGKAFHYTSNGDINELTFLTSEGREFVVSGFSLIRYSNFVHWYIVGGAVFSPDEWELLNLEAKELDVANAPPWKRLFLEEVATRRGGNFGHPTPLEGTVNTQRTAVAGEFDITTGKHLSRCYMSESDNAFAIVSDDPEMFDYIKDAEKRESVVAQLSQQVEEAAVLWSLGQAMLQLPSYFAFKMKVARSVAAAAGRSLRTVNKGGRGTDARFKSVTSIDYEGHEEVPVRVFTPPHYSIDPEGFWRRLAVGAKGRGPNGEHVIGKTWVKRGSGRRADSDQPRTVFVKSTVASARLQIEEMLRLAEAAEDRGRKNSDRGVLYVLRCPAMKEEVYKVGWTSGTAEERSKELSAATGVPAFFVVTDTWAHPDPAGFEKNVHALLDPYRLTDRREFFQLDYQVLRRIIQQEFDRSTAG